jgi:hypothetical protein
MKEFRRFLPWIAILVIAPAVWVFAGPDQHVDNPAIVKSEIKVYSETIAETTDIAAAVTDRKFRILSFSAVATSGTAETVRLSNGDNNLIGTAAAPLKLDQDGTDGPMGIMWNHNPGGWCETDTVTEALTVTLGATTPVHVTCTYVETM